MQQLMQRAPRVLISNLTSNVSFKMQFNPTQLREQLAANYANQQVPGLSQEVMQFVNTRNRTFEFDLYFDVTRVRGESVGYNPLFRTRAELRSLLYPRRAPGLTRAGPPRAMWDFPGFGRWIGFLTSLGITYLRFNKKGEPCSMTANCTFEEQRDFSVFSEDVWSAGANAKGGSPFV